MQADEKWFPGLLHKCLLFADFQSLVACESVNRDWRQTAQERALWEALYCSRWRNGELFSDKLHVSAAQLKRMHWQRRHVSLDVSSGARVFKQSDGTVRVHNEFLEYTLYGQDIVSTLCSTRLQPLILTDAMDTAAISHEHSVHYFEARIDGCGSVGLVAVNGEGQQVFDRYGAQSKAHLGWHGVSYGYHGDDGRLYWNLGPRATEGEIEAYGPAWGTLRSAVRRQTPVVQQEQKPVIGCGYVATNGRLFFTKNGEFLGYTEAEVDTEFSYAASVSLHYHGNSAVINLGRAPYVFDIEGFIAKVHDEQQDPRDADPA